MSKPDRSHAERVSRMRAAAAGAEGPWAAKRALARTLRELLARLPSSAVSDEELRELVPVLRAAAERVAAAGRAPASARPASLYAGMENFQDTGPIVGLSNPIAPPLEASVDAEAGVVRARARFSAAYEGAPGLLHGGFLAAAFDELLGLATVFSGGAGMTRDLSVRYLRPTPIGVELSFTGRLDRVDGRRLFVSAEVEANGIRTAEASPPWGSPWGLDITSIPGLRRRNAACTPYAPPRIPLRPVLLVPTPRAKARSSTGALAAEGPRVVRSGPPWAPRGGWT